MKICVIISIVFVALVIISLVWVAQWQENLHKTTNGKQTQAVGPQAVEAHVTSTCGFSKLAWRTLCQDMKVMDQTPEDLAKTLVSCTAFDVVKACGPNDQIWQDSPLAPIPVFDVPAFNVLHFGAMADGTTDDTEAFEKAIDAVAKAGRGAVVVPSIKAESETQYLIRPINLTSNMELFISANTRIIGVADEKAWPVIPGAPSYGQGRDHKGPRHTSLIHGEHLQNITIRGSGNSSVIDGQGAYWWDRHFRGQDGGKTRGHIIEIMYSRNVAVYDVSLHNSPFWNNHFYDCDQVHVRGVNILAPVDSPNTDGFDPDSSRNVLIEDSWYHGGDDCVAIKSGWDCFGVWYGKPSVNVTVRNLNCHGLLAGISIGSEMSGGVENVKISNCRFSMANQPAHVKTGPSRGGFIHNVVYSDLRIDGPVDFGIWVDAGPQQANPSCPPNWRPPSQTSMHNFSFLNFDGWNAPVRQGPFHFNGPSAESPITGVYMENVHFGNGQAQPDWLCNNVSGSANRVDPWPACRPITPTHFTLTNHLKIKDIVRPSTNLMESKLVMIMRYAADPTNFNVHVLAGLAAGLAFFVAFGFALGKRRSRPRFPDASAGLLSNSEPYLVVV